ncbi:PREDICTED: RNA polymerase II degradation factor 1-like [Vollenhovia emeryi]|uniref:RNA polymerase II degradation factor 1-like n=1 Tax=Vollenhovia emeryi TaxID=411798 RepID=UPI0005F4B02D|nr:PREDICTED: RNA polymerase II degradation factor 1-like [Vollenhovia emeryi]
MKELGKQMIDSNFNFLSRLQKVYLILGLLVAATCAEKKINLEDIERDNLRAEGKTKPESIQTDETKYIAKPNQQQYQIPSQYNTLSHPELYAPPQQLQDIKYSQVPPEEYVQPNQYAVHEAQYKQPSQILPQQNIPPVQYYSGYQQQVEIPAKGIAPIAFEHQKLNYQPEIAVGNHIQSVQQKAVTEKYTKTVNKEPLYIDVPVTQLLPYYPYLDNNPLVGLKGVGLAQPPLQLAANAAQQIPLPLYAPIYNQNQLIPPVKSPYVGPVAFTTKTPKGSTYAIPGIPKKKISPLYVQPQQPLAQGKTLLHTQAYIAPSHPQYVQQLVYTQPGLVYSDPAAAYSDFYARLPAYIQDNYLRGQVNQYQTQQQLYVAPPTGHEAPKEVLQEQISQDQPQNYIKVPDEPKTHFVPPQFPPYDFKAGSTQLEAVRSSFEDEQAPPVQDHSLPSEPRSLLDTYIPSQVIAAQDSARYKERPIQLEGGFLPSKANFALKKRKSE